jgi:hypothetical protein
MEMGHMRGVIAKSAKELPVSDYCSAPSIVEHKKRKEKAKVEKRGLTTLQLCRSEEVCAGRKSFRQYLHP